MKSRKKLVKRITAFAGACSLALSLVHPVIARADELLEPLEGINYLYQEEFVDEDDNYAGPGNEKYYVITGNGGEYEYTYTEYLANKDLIILKIDVSKFHGYQNRREAVLREGTTGNLSDCYLVADTRYYDRINSETVNSGTFGETFVSFDEYVNKFRAQQQAQVDEYNDEVLEETSENYTKTENYSYVEKSYGNRVRIGMQEYYNLIQDDSPTRDPGERLSYSRTARLWETGSILIPCTEFGLSEKFNLLVYISYTVSYYTKYWTDSDKSSDPRAEVEGLIEREIDELSGYYEQYIDELATIEIPYTLERHLAEEPGYMETTTEASEKEGETKSVEIPPWVWALPPIVVLPPLVNKGRRRKKKKQAEKEQQEQQQPQGILELRINKNFGNTLLAGADPVMVGARIVEVFPTGEKPRPDLTSMIAVSSADGYLRVNPSGMDGMYQNAYVEALADAQQIPQQAAVAFTINAPGAVFTNRVLFNIAGQKINFFQDNLTLPAVYDKIVRLPFETEGIPENVQLGVELDGDAYELNGIENGDRPNLYYVVFSEKIKTKDKAGKYETYDLTVTANIQSSGSPTGVRQIKGSIPVIRFHMGLAVYMPGYIGCYLEKYDPRVHGTYRDLIFKNETDGTEYSPAVTDVSIAMITWDEETHKIVRGKPKFENNLFTLEPLNEEDDAKTTDYMSRATWQKTDAEIIQMVGIYPECYKICDDGSYHFKLRTSGLIDAPARRKVNFKIKAVFRGETYEFEKKVWLFSQKPRDCGAAEMEELRKTDRQITKDLRYIADTINGHDLYEKLGAVYRVAKMMLDGFEERFGYDVNLYYVVKGYFNRVCRGISVGANAKPEDMPEYPPDMGFVCDVMQALHDSYDTHEKALESWAMILPRMGLAGLTFGISEGVFSSMKVCHDMIDTVNNGGSELDAFIAGVKEPLSNFVSEKLMQTGMNMYTKGVKGGFKDVAKQFSTELDDVVLGEAKRQMGAISESVENAIKNLKNCAPEYHGNRTMESLNAMKSSEKSVAKEADDLIKDFRRKGEMSAEAVDMDAVARQASLEGLNKAKRAERAYYDYARYKTPEAEAEFKAAWLEVKKDLEAVRQMDIADTPAMRNVKSEGFRLEEAMHERINKGTISRSVEEMRAKGKNISEDDIYVLNASGTSNEAKYRGDKVAHDRDTTFMEKGKVSKDNPGGLDTDVDADVIERNYAMAAYKEMYGVEAESLEIAKKAVSDHHFVTVQGDSLEKVGENITEARKYFDPTHFGEKYTDASRVASSLEYKVNECFIKGEEELSLANTAATEAEKEMHLMEAIRNFGEGERTFGGKVSDNVVLRCTANNTVSQISREERLIMQIFKQTEAAGHTGPTTLSTIEAIELIKKMGYKPTDTGTMIKDIVLRTEK